MKTNSAISVYLERHGYCTLKPEVVLFDMDGVLFDSMQFHAKAWIKALGEHGIPFGEYDAYMNEGRTGSSTINEYFLRYKGRKPSEEEEKNIYESKSHYFNEISETKPIPDVTGLIALLQKDSKSIYLVTGSGQKSLLETLEHHFPGTFVRERMVTAYDVTNCKPDPEPYLTALGRAGVSADRAVVIENSPLGVKSGSAAGIFTIAVNTGILDDNILYEYGADIVMHDMKSLIDEYSNIFI